MPQRSQPLWRVSVRTTAEAEDAVVELLGTLAGLPPTVYTDTERHRTTASVYLESVPLDFRRQLRAGLHAIRAAGLELGAGTVSVRPMLRENWAESWKRHFPPLEIGPKLLVLPSWSTRKPKAGQVSVILDPGLSFGTGHHPTTAFCLEQVANLRDADRPQQLLDIGCGSGILAIAASMLGYKPVVAFDFDAEAVRVAKENARVNRQSFDISQRDLTRVPRRPRQRFDVVCANLMYDLLIPERERILARLAPGGTLVLAGILRKQFPAVRRAFEDFGLKMVASRAAKEWRSGAFRFDRSRVTSNRP